MAFYLKVILRMKSFTVMNNLLSLLCVIVFSFLTPTASYASGPFKGLRPQVSLEDGLTQNKTNISKVLASSIQVDDIKKVELGTFEKTLLLNELKKQKIVLPKIDQKLESRGGMDSGGGAGFVDQNGNVHIMDLVEARKEKIQIDFGPAETSAMQKVAYVLKRMATVAPVRVSIYIEWASTFVDEIEWLESTEEINSPTNISSQVIPVGSKPVLVALQRTEDSVELGQKRYLINGSLLAKLDSESQATLILHEIVYRDLLSRQNSNPTEVRFIVKKLIDRNFNLQTYNTLMGYQLFSQTEWNGIGPLDAVKGSELSQTLSFEGVRNISAKIVNGKRVIQEYGIYDKKGNLIDLAFGLKNYEISEKLRQAYPQLKNWDLESGLVLVGKDLTQVEFVFTKLTYRPTQPSLSSPFAKLNKLKLITPVVPEGAVAKYFTKLTNINFGLGTYDTISGRVIDFKIIGSTLDSSFIFNNKLIPLNYKKAQSEAFFQTVNDKLCLIKTLDKFDNLKLDDPNHKEPVEQLFTNECIPYD